MTTTTETLSKEERSSAELAKQFLKLVREHEALQWGDFVLKSGRSSPYFLNVGNLSTGAAAAKLAELYAVSVKKMVESRQSGAVEYLTLFGPAYKGIPLAALTAAELSRDKTFSETTQVGYAYTRKESKDHGEKGNLVGKLKGAVIIIDDVITAGTAVTQTLQIVDCAIVSAGPGVRLLGVVVGFERLEKAVDDNSGRSALTMLGGEQHFATSCIANAGHLLRDLEQGGENENARRLADHLAKYGTADRETGGFVSPSPVAVI